MIRAMYSGISGMKVNQTKLDVTGNNIANVGTTGFKNSRVRFQDMLSQNVSEALGPGRSLGGVNPRQVGLGVQVAGIDTVVTQGMMQPTSRNLDAAVDGEGYFMVARGALPESNAGGISVSESDHTMSGGDLEISYTRDGAFTLDQAGNLLTSDGYRVMGYSLNEKDDDENATGDPSIDYSANGTINFVDSDGKNGLKASGNLVPLRIPDSVYMKADDLSTETEMKYTGSAEKKIFDTDNTKVGMEGYAKIKTNGAFKGKEDIKIEIKYTDKDKDTTTDDKGWMVFINGKNTYLEATSTEASVNKTAIDGVDVALLSTDEKAQLNDLLNGSEVKVTGPDTTVIPTDEESKYKWSFTLNSEGDKKIRSFSMEKDGVIKAVLDDGSVSALGQIAMASFKNPAGLKKLGKNLYQNTSNSGQTIVRSGIGGPKNLDNSKGYGTVMQGMLEMSNVDLAEQFTDMIVTTRAFQAAGKMISTGDEILQDIINLKR